MAHSGRFSERIATRSPGWIPRLLSPSESARTVNPKSLAEMGRHCPSTFDSRRFGLPVAAADANTSQSVRISVAIVLLMRGGPRLRSDCVAAAQEGQGSERVRRV